MSRRLLALLALSVFLSAASHAQSEGGGIIGRGRDPRGDAVPAALIQVVNTSTGQIRAINYNRVSGLSDNSLKRIGKYQVLRELRGAGFRSA